MIIENANGKFYTDDSSARFEDGVWEVDDTKLVPYEEYLASVKAEELAAQRSALESELEGIKYADPGINDDALQNAAEMYNEVLTIKEVGIREELDRLK